jgi:TP901 family phage tail tape measure protein
MASEKLIVEMVFQAGDTKPAFDNVEKGASKAGAKAGSNFAAAFGGKVKSQLVSVGKQFAAIAVASVGFRAIASNVNEAVNSIRSFERALANVNSILPKNEKLTKESISTFQDFAGSFGTTAALQADAFYTIVSAGIKGTSKQLDVLETANSAAVAGLVNIDDAARVLVSSMNSYAQAGLTAEKASDILFVAVREGQTTFQELANFLGNVAPVAASAGLSFEELAGSIAGITKAGIKTDIAVTGVKALLTTLLKQAPEAVAVAKKLGLEFSATALRTKGLVGFLGDLQKKTKGNSETLSKLFPNVRALTPILQVVNGNFQDFARIQEEVKNSLGATAAAAAIIKKSLDFKLTQATANFALFRQELTNFFIPAISDAASAISRFLILNRDSASSASKLKAQIGNSRVELEKWATIMQQQGSPALESYNSQATFAQKKVFLLTQEIKSMQATIQDGKDAKIIGESPVEQLLQAQRELKGFNDRLTAIKENRFDPSEVLSPFELIANISEKEEEINRLTVSVGLLGKALEKVPEQSKKVTAGLTSIQKTGKILGDQLRASLASGISRSIQTVITSIGKGEDAFKNFGKLILNVIGDMAIKMGQTLIFAGLGIESLKALGGAAAIAAGAGLVAIGTIIKNASGGAPSVGSGGGLGGVSDATTVADDNEDFTSPEEVERTAPSTNVEVVVQGSLVQQEELGQFITETLNESFGKQGVTLTDARFA